ncbi:arrestin domain-containing protein 3-like [Neosynchiropus ocellatus]
MSSTVKSLKVTYNPVNETNTFRVGDTVSGQVALEVAKDCEIQSLSIKFKAKAEVMWSERHGQTTHYYHSKDKYFTVKHYFVRDKDKKDEDFETLLTQQNGETYGNVVAPGCHIYPFSFVIPPGDMPSSFKGEYGKIVFLLEAKLSRSMRINKTDTAKLNFVTSVDASLLPQITAPQHDTVEKKMKVFSSGAVSMDARLEKTGFAQGEGIKVLVCAQNNSSRPIKPKFCIYTKHCFFAEGRRKCYTKDLLKEVGNPIPPSSNENVTTIINVPHDVQPSILNCQIITVEYRLRVYLDVKYASDPEIKFPIIILPAAGAPSASLPEAASATFGFEALNIQNQPSFAYSPLQAPPEAPYNAEAPPPYGAHSMYPTYTITGLKY